MPNFEDNFEDDLFPKNSTGCAKKKSPSLIQNCERLKRDEVFKFVSSFREYFNLNFVYYFFNLVQWFKSYDKKSNLTLFQKARKIAKNSEQSYYLIELILKER